MLPKIKSKAFILLLPKIFELREQGYSYEEVTAILEKEYGLILSVNQFSVYLARYKNAHTLKVEKQTETSLAPTLHQGSKQDPIQSDSKTKDYIFGTPEHKAHVLAESQDFLNNYEPPKIGLRQRK
jgi:intein-encoded DNA endonuclease-like protein